MNKKKVLQLISSIGFFGAENVIAELVTELATSEFEPIIGVIRNLKNPHLELVDFARKNNIESVIFEAQRQFDLQAIASIRNFIKGNNVDIVQTHGYKSDFYGIFAALFENVHLLATCHPWIKTSRRGKAYAKIDKLLLKKFSRIVAISDQVKKEILDAGIPDNKISIIDNGINLHRFEEQFDTKEIRKQFGIPLESQVIGTVGRLDLEKGHHILLEAAKIVIQKNPSTFFVIVGDGYLKNDLTSRAEELKIEDHILLPGTLKEIPKILSVFDIFVLPSLTEGLPMALLEAMAAKKPVIASRVGAIPKVIIDYETGILIKPGDVNELSNGIIDLLRDKDKANLIVKNAYNKIVQEFSSNRMAKQYINIYENMLASNGDI
jgi:glycosyltransferase involved in cell wall biosynthesis